MSLETFKERFPASPEIIAMVARLKRPDESAIAALCKSLVQESGSGLKELLNKTSGGDVAIEPDKFNLLALTPKARDLAALHYSGILFGISIRALERTVITRAYDADSFAIDYNLAIAGTPLKAAQSSEEQIAPLSNSDLSTMYQLIERDRTFGIFFQNEEIESIPNPLRKHLKSTGLLPEMREAILPMYKKRAEFLIPS